MKIIFGLLFVCLSLPSYAQLVTGNGSDLACDENTINNGDLDYDCTTLDINNPAVFAALTPTIKIRVQGAVNIRANITLNGVSGVSSSFSNGSGGLGGPGATEGGDISGGVPAPGGNVFNDPSIANGQEGGTGIGVCGGGGAGAGMFLAGSAGIACGAAAGGVAGLSAVGTGDFAFTLVGFRGGFGGGSGGPGGIGSIETGTGGGGGGGLHIVAGGDVTIFEGVTISAKGGNGGNSLAVNSGGGGGGGSGGAVWIQTNGLIINNGTIDLQRGLGGLNHLGVTSGGDGADGPYQLEDSTGIIISGTGLRGPTVETAKSLNSNISCGTVKSNDTKTFFQMSFGFVLAAMLASLIKILFRYRLKT